MDLSNAFKLFDLSGRVALVTGAADGLGKAMAIGLASFGADIAVSDVNKTGLQPVIEAGRALGVRAKAFPCDNSQPDQIYAMFLQLDEIFGHIARGGEAYDCTRSRWQHHKHQLNIQLDRSGPG